ncbi:nuclear transport factor 2 family protein [Lentzea tibetensis]|uniref:Nuclear transport factor 2 family protein n=1 Tax=Lentzea tibetensis TaxID=2591470 RepID=A0A563EWE0_9PSEU|nr:nuclear transport factor 2 family protein [Lentzea tibetensis]TWP51848.1 nuclear transport factor 2 family protein [Lentzea tibetensis]
MDELTAEVLAAAARGDWDALKPLLHPYLHWSDGEAKLRGRTKVLAHLAAHPVGPPAEVELRDGQVYRWIGRPAE